MTDNIVASLAGALLALLFGYAPGLRQWYEALEPTRKALTMAGLLLAAAVLLYIERNTVVAGPQTRTAINVGVNERGRPHRDSYVRYNAIDMSGATDDAEPATGDATNVTWHDNAWTRLPAADFRHGDDVIGFQLIAPLAALANEFPAAGHTLDIDNYRPRAGSAVATAGLGALPVGPVGPPPPGDGPDWAALLEKAATVGALLAAMGGAGNVAREHLDAAKEQLAVMSLAHEDAKDNLAALLTMLDEYRLG